MKGLKLSAYADLAELANLPKVIKAIWHEKEHYFWAPAFKVRPDIFPESAAHPTLQDLKG